MGYLPFVKSLSKALHEDLNMITSLPMFVDPHATFVMLSFCCA